MNYQVFSYMPTASATAASADPPPRPIRVTPSALSPLLYAILYSIEFQSPIGPRPPTLRERSAASSKRGSVGPGGAGGGGAGSAGSAAAVAPSAAALLTSAVSVVSSFWGRTSTNATAVPATNAGAGSSSAAASMAQAQPSASHPQHPLASGYGVGGGSALDATAQVPTPSLSPSRAAVTLAEEAELAALQRQHEQPFVVPVTQVLHKLGGVHITVRETHNPTITTAYARAMEEVEMIVSEHEQRMARQMLRSASFPSQPAAVANASASPSSAALLRGAAGVRVDGSPLSAAAAADGEHGGHVPSSGGAAVVDAHALSGLPASPTSLSRSVLGAANSPSTAAAAAAWISGGRGSEWGCGGRLDELTAGMDEVGLVLSVRLLSKEVTRWRISYERPLAEWRFPIIRTANERMMIRPRLQNPALTASSAASSAAAAVTSQEGRDLGASDGGSCGAASDYILVNDSSQIYQVLEFILKSSYQTTSMETFTDFTSGELVFDAHVQERRRFH